MDDPCVAVEQRLCFCLAMSCLSGIIGPAEVGLGMPLGISK